MPEERGPRLASKETAGKRKKEQKKRKRKQKEGTGTQTAGGTQGLSSEERGSRRDSKNTRRGKRRGEGRRGRRVCPEWMHGRCKYEMHTGAYKRYLLLKGTSTVLCRYDT